MRCCTTEPHAHRCEQCEAHFRHVAGTWVDLPGGAVWMCWPCEEAERAAQLCTPDLSVVRS